MKKLLQLLLIILLFSSCNPKMYVWGKIMRDFNTSKNKYSKQKPYIKVE